MEQLADEKLVLAQRVVDLISRARAKLDHELSRVLVQQGEDPNSTATLAVSSVSIPRRNALQEIKETLRTPRETTPVVSIVPAPSQVAGNKSDVLSRRFSLRIFTNASQGGELLEGLRPIQQVMGALHPPQDIPEPDPSVLPASLLQITIRALGNHLSHVDKPPLWKPMRMVKVRKTMATKKTRTCIVSARSFRTER